MRICGSAQEFVTRAQILDSGFRDPDIRAAVAAGTWVRPRRGYYTSGALWYALDDVDRHVLVLRMISHQYAGRVAFTHQSSLAVRRRAMLLADLRISHVTRLDAGSTRREAGIVHHRSDVVRERDLVEERGLLVSREARALWEAGTLTTTEGALVSINDALYAGSVTHDEMLDVGSLFGHWPASRHVRLALMLSDARVETPGETRSLYLFWEHGIPRPELQSVITTADGEFVGRTDFRWEKYRHLGEFDGMEKYRRWCGDDETPSQVVEQEKAREDALRGQGYGMSRIVWADFSDERRRATAVAIRRALDQSRRLYAKGRVTIVL